MAGEHVYIVIPVHNRLSLTLDCLAALSQQTERDFTMVIVDDGSTDGTGAALAREHPAARVLAGDGSLWWTGAMNLGVSWVLSQSGPSDFILTLNNDTVPPPKYIEGLLRAHAAAPGALIGSVLVRADDERTIIDGGVHVNWLTAKYRADRRGTTLRLYDEHRPNLKPVDVLSGCGTLVPVRTFRCVGPYDQNRLRHYAADFEFSRRARRAGFELFVDWSSHLFVHETETGIHASVAASGLRGLLRSFRDTRSANDFRTRLSFALSACPRWALPLYVPMDYARVVVGSIRRYRSGNGSAGAATRQSVC